MLFANVCEGFISSCYGEYCKWRFFVLFGFSSVSCVYGERVLGSLLCARLVCSGVPPAGHALWAGGITFCNLWEEHLKVHKTAYEYLGIYVGVL